MPTKSPPAQRRSRKAAPTPLETALRRAILTEQKKDPAVTDYAIAKRIGVAQSVVGRFLNDGLSLTLHTAGKLCEAFGLTLQNKSEKSRDS